MAAPATALRGGQPVLLLDVMDTLIWDPVWVMADFFEAPFEELMAVKHPTAWVDFELGKIDEPTFLDSFFIDGRSYDQQLAQDEAS